MWSSRSDAVLRVCGRRVADGVQGRLVVATTQSQRLSGARRSQTAAAEAAVCLSRFVYVGGPKRARVLSA